MRSFLVAVGLLLVTGAAGCGGADGPTGTGGSGSAQQALCIPGQQLACACLGGGDGVQVCEDSGARMGACDCPMRGTTSASSTAASTTGAGGESGTGGGGGAASSSASVTVSTSASSSSASSASATTGGGCVPITSHDACAALGPVSGIVGLAADGCGGLYACTCPTMPDVHDNTVCDAPNQMLYCGEQTGKLSGCKLTVYNSEHGWEYCCAPPS